AVYPVVLDPTLSAELAIDPVLAIGPAYGAQDHPAIAFDGTNYLVAWDGVGATRVAPNGAVLDPLGIPIPFLGTLPAVAFDGTRYIVVAATPQGKIIAARVATDGTVLDPNGIDVGTGTTPSVAAQNGTFVVVWEDGLAIRVKRIAPDGTPGA